MNQGVELTGYEHMAHDKLIEESTSISARLMAAYAGRRRRGPRRGRRGEYRDVKPFEKGFTLPKLFSVK
jgi:hypothetical protein